MKLHVKNKHSITNVDGNISLDEIIEGEKVQKHFVLKAFSISADNLKDFKLNLPM